MKRNACFILLLILSYVLSSCDNTPAYFESRRNTSEMAAIDRPDASYENADFKKELVNHVSESAPEPPPQNIKVANQTPRKLIKEGSIAFKCSSLKETYAFISKLAQQHEAYISNENENRYTREVRKSVTVRVPAQNFDALINTIEQQADELEHKTINVQDVTEEFIDTEARVKTKKDLEMRYRELLKQSRSIDEMLSVESQLSTVRGEIESMEGRLKYLADRVNYSTLTVIFYESIGTDYGFASKFADALRQGWDNLLLFLIGTVNIWPFLLIAIAAIFAFRSWRKKRRAVAVPVEKS